MGALLTNISSILTNLLSWMGSVATALIGNEIFQIMLAVIFLILFVNLIRYIVVKIKLNKWYKKDYEEWKNYMESIKVKK